MHAFKGEINLIKIFILCLKIVSSSFQVKYSFSCKHEKIILSMPRRTLHIQFVMLEAKELEGEDERWLATLLIGCSIYLPSVCF